MSDLDLSMIYSDSRLNSDTLGKIISYLKPLGIMNLSYHKIDSNGYYSIVMTYDCDEMSAYYRSQIWKYDDAINFDGDVYIRIIDYMEIPQIHQTDYLFYAQNEICVVIQYYIFGVKNVFHFSVQRQKYLDHFNDAGFLYGFNMVLDSVIKWLYAGVRMRCCIDLNVHHYPFKNLFQSSQSRNQVTVLGGIILTTREVDYLKVISMGCTAKEIAMHIGKSPRSVEKAIFDLKSKLRVDSKDQLVCIAKTLLAQR